MNEHKKEVKMMWRDLQQLLRVHLEKLVRRNRLGKIEAMAEEVGMSVDEFHNKISINPRTPITNAERISIEHEIARRDPQVYIEYLKQLHACESLELV